MAGKTAVLSVRIVSDSRGGVAGLARTAAAVTGLERVVRRSGSALASMTRSAPKIAAVATAVGSLAAVGLSSVGAVLAVAGSLAAIGPAALALPGLFFGAAVAVGVLKAAFADAGTVLADLGPAWSGLQDTISESYWARAAQPIRDLSASVLPTLQTELRTTAQIMGLLTAAAATQLQQSLGTHLAPMLLNVRRGLLEASGGVRPLLAGLVDLTSVGTTYLPGLGAAIGRIATQLGTGLSAAAASGALQQWIDTALAGLRDLGTVAVQATGIVAALVQAASAAGGGGLGALGESLRSINAALSGPVGQGALTTIFAGAYAGVAALAPGLSAIGSALVALSPALAYVMQAAGMAASVLLTTLGGALSQIGPGLQAGFAGILVGVQQLGPALSGLGPLASSVFTLFGAIASQVLPIVGQLFAALAPVITAAATALDPLVSALGAGLQTALATLLPPITQFATALLPQLGAAAMQLLPALAPIGAAVLQLGSTLLSTLLPVVSQLVTAVLPVFVSIVTQLAPAFASVLTAVAPLVVQLVSGLAPILTQLITGVLPPLVPIVQQAAAVIGVLAAAFAPLIATIIGGLLPVLSQLVATVTTVFASVQSIISGALNVVTGIVNTFAGLLTGDWDRTWQGLVQIVSGAGQMIAGAARGIVSLVTGALSTLGSALYEIGTAAMQGLINGIKAIGSGIGGVISDLVGGGIAAAKSALGIKSPSRVFRKIGEQTGQGLQIGLERSRTPVRRAAAALAGATVAAAKPVRAAVVRPWAETVAGIKSTIRAGTPAAVTTARRAMRDLRAIFINSPATTVRQGTRQWNTIVQDQARNARTLAARMRPIGRTTVRTLMNDLTGGAAAVKRGTARLRSAITTQLNMNRPGGALGRAMAPTSTYYRIHYKRDVDLATAQLSRLAATRAKLTKQLAAARTTTATLGAQAARGLIGGLQAQIRSVDTAAEQLASTLIGSVRTSLDIHSPSRVFRTIGQQVGRGMVLGITSQARAVQSATEQMLHRPDAAVQRFNARPLELRTGAGGGAGGREVHHHHHYNFNGLVTDRMGAARELRALWREADMLTGGKW